MKTSDHILPFRLKSLNNQIRRKLDKTAIDTANSELTGMHFAVLGFLAEQTGDVYQKDIEAEFNIRRSTASSMLKLMEKNGYILRAYDTVDTRLKKITPTKKARELDKIAKANILSLQEQMTRGIPPEELEQLYSTLKKISDNLEK